MSETSWDGDPNTPHPDNPYNEGGDIEYARQRVLDKFNSSADEIRSYSTFCSVEDTRRKQQEEWDYYQRPTGTSPPHTRGSCIMGIKEALHRLTSNDKDKSDEEDEWIVIKVPKRTQHKIFFVDYCDGDSEDELHWLEGPYLQEEISVADLLVFRRAQPRSSRRRRGLTEFRNDPEEDGKDPPWLSTAEPNSS